MQVKLSDLEGAVISGVKKLGYQEEEVKVISDVLLYAQLRNNNQGITKIATGGVPLAKDVKPLQLIKENKCGAMFSGGHSMIATDKAVEKALSLAKEHGVGIATVNNTYSSSGALGYFSRKIAKEGMIGLVCVGNGPFAFVAPHGPAEAKLGTNPFSYSFPFEGGEVVFDNATAAIAYFGVVEAKLKSEELPEGLGFDKAGNPSINPADVLEGSVATFADHKGYGLSLLVQLLGGPLALAGFPGYHEDDGAGTFVLAIDPEILAGKKEFLKRSTELVKSLQASKPLDGYEKVYVPGERGDQITSSYKKSGTIEVPDGVWNELQKFLSK